MVLHRRGNAVHHCDRIVRKNRSQHNFEYFQNFSGRSHRLRFSGHRSAKRLFQFDASAESAAAKEIHGRRRSVSCFFFFCFLRKAMGSCALAKRNLTTFRFVNLSSYLPPHNVSGHPTDSNPVPENNLTS